MTIQERIDYFGHIFDLLQETNSRNEKNNIVNDIPPELEEDFNYIVECLDGKYKFGYKYYRTTPIITTYMSPESTSLTVKTLLRYLQIPMTTHDLREDNIHLYVETTNIWYDFLEPIVNRTLRLGIRGSLLDKTDLSPMLAKKFDGSIKFDKEGYYITEKLDGNRCIAHYENGKWEFTSRNGKPMHVNFDMTGFDKNRIYDGEVLAPVQVAMSNAIMSKVIYNVDCKTSYADNFNTTSGLINQHNSNKKLIYNVFDIIENSKYKDRRDELNRIRCTSDDVRVLPILQHCKTIDELENITKLLDTVVNIGGEGLMINLANADYIHKRTDQLLKLKKVQTMDMKVYNFTWGTGKYEGMIGALEANGITEDGKEIYCSVGTGLSDYQRTLWANEPDKILNKIIEVSYFSISQSKEDKKDRTNIYSLRFPRLKKVRNDKTSTSEY